jgi:hypothetical protein
MFAKDAATCSSVTRMFPQLTQGLRNILRSLTGVEKQVAATSIATLNLLHAQADMANQSNLMNYRMRQLSSAMDGVRNALTQANTTLEVVSSDPSANAPGIPDALTLLPGPLPMTSVIYWVPPSYRGSTDSISSYELEVPGRRAHDREYHHQLDATRAVQHVDRSGYRVWLQRMGGRTRSRAVVLACDVHGPGTILRAHPLLQPGWRLGSRALERVVRSDDAMRHRERATGTSHPVRGERFELHADRLGATAGAATNRRVRPMDWSGRVAVHLQYDALCGNYTESVPGDASPLRVAVAEYNTQYTYTVTATNAAGSATSDPSDSSEYLQ